MDPITAATHLMLTACAADLRKTLTGMGDADLNRAPAPEANSVAVILAHAVAATKASIEAALSGRLDRRAYMAERPAAFATSGATGEWARAQLADLDAAIARLEGATLTDELGRVADLLGATDMPLRTRAWWLIHGLEHLREHLGHTQLTEQVLKASGGRG